MHIKDYILDSGYKSRKFLLVLLSIIIIIGSGILWAATLWPVSILSISIEAIVTLVLGYCGISAARIAIPTASSAIAKTITTNKTLTHSAINAKENLAGAKDLI